VICLLFEWHSEKDYSACIITNHLILCFAVLGLDPWSFALPMSSSTLETKLLSLKSELNTIIDNRNREKIDDIFVILQKSVVLWVREADQMSIAELEGLSTAWVLVFAML